MKPAKYAFEKALQDLDDSMKQADVANDAFTHIFGAITPREDYEETEVQALREKEV